MKITAAKWFKSRHGAKRVQIITEPHYREHSNSYLIRSERAALLIDSGIGVVNLHRHLVETLESSPQFVLTHTHYDHVGGAADFNQVSVHEAGVNPLMHPSPQSTAECFYLQDDFPEIADFSQEIQAAVRSFRIRPFRPATEDSILPLRGGETITIGQLTFQVIHTPGHSPDSICLFEQTLGWLFSGDTLYDGTLYWDIPGASLADYHRSMATLRDLDVNKCFPGHNQMLERRAFLRILEEKNREIESALA